MGKFLGGIFLLLTLFTSSVLSAEKNPAYSFLPSEDLIRDSDESVTVTGRGGVNQHIGVFLVPPTPPWSFNRIPIPAIETFLDSDNPNPALTPDLRSEERSSPAAGSVVVHGNEISISPIWTPPHLRRRQASPDTDTAGSGEQCFVSGDHDNENPIKKPPHFRRPQASPDTDTAGSGEQCLASGDHDNESPIKIWKPPHFRRRQATPDPNTAGISEQCPVSGGQEQCPVPCVHRDENSFSSPALLSVDAVPTTGDSDEISFSQLSLDVICEIEIVEMGNISPEVIELVSATREGLRLFAPRLAGEGTGGTYLLSDVNGRHLSIFKPRDEEPGGINNPRRSNTVGESLKPGTHPGEGADKEVIAYLLDEGFSGVPPTTLVRCIHSAFINADGFVLEKIGSLQMFVPNEGSYEEHVPPVLPLEGVHRMAILDLRLANSDRHAGNVLIGQNEEDTILIPIDHGYCLPTSFEDVNLEWMWWREAEMPFSLVLLEYIDSLNPESDLQIIQNHGLHISDESARTLRLSTLLLKRAAKKGLSAAAIAGILTSGDLDRFIHMSDEGLIEAATFIDSILHSSRAA